MLLALQLLNLLEEAGAGDGTPDQFTFTDQSGVALSSTITSAAVTITGIDTTVSFSATGGTIDVNSDGNFQTSRDVVNGDTIRARHTSSASYVTATNTVVTGGGVSDTFTSTTQADPGAVYYIHGGTAINANGQMVTTYLDNVTAVPGTARFVGGIAHDETGARYVCPWPSGSVFYHGGIAVRSDGAMVISTGSPEYRHGGMPTSYRGEVIVSENAAALTHGGWSYDSDGKLCVTNAD